MSDKQTQTLPLLISWLIIRFMPTTHLDLIPGLAELQLAHWPDQSKYLQTIDKTNHTNIGALIYIIL